MTHSLGVDRHSNHFPLEFLIFPHRSNPFEVDLELDGLSPGAKDFNGGSLSYLLEITDPNSSSDLAELRWNTGAPSPSVTKQIRSDSSSRTASLICSLSTDPSQRNISGRIIWIRDTL